jgi:hypothetical protein
MKFVGVDREGNFSVKGDLRVLYSVMLAIRVAIVLESFNFFSRALTISTRYAVLRR